MYPPGFAVYITLGVMATSTPPLPSTSQDFALQLLHAAEEMLASGRYEVAVVTAQMACEMSVEQVFGVFFEARGLSDLEAPIEDLLPSYNLGNDKVRRLYSALTFDQVSREFFWSEYKTMVSIRNKAVHAGGRVQQSQAAMALRIAAALLEHLNLVLAQATETAAFRRKVEASKTSTTGEQ